MRQWSVDVSSDDAFSPYSPYSPLSQRSTNGSLRSLPTNTDRVPGHKRHYPTFPAAPMDSHGANGHASRRNCVNDTTQSFIFNGTGIGGSENLGHEASGRQPRRLSSPRGRPSFTSGQRRGRSAAAPDEEERWPATAGQQNNFYPNSFALASGASSDTSDGEEEGEQGSARGLRLSRHIPRREGMDMSVSAYNLLEANGNNNGSSSSCGPHLAGSPASLHSLVGSGSSSVLLAAGRGGARGHRGALSVSPGATTTTASTTAAAGTIGAGSLTPAIASLSSLPSIAHSLTDSQVSDDSTYMTALYNDLLADKLTAYHRVGDSGSGTHGASNLCSGGGGDPALLLTGGDDGGDDRDGCGSDGGDSSPHALHLQRRGGIGGEVLRFAGGQSISNSISGNSSGAVTAGSTRGDTMGTTGDRLSGDRRLAGAGSSTCGLRRVGAGSGSAAAMSAASGGGSSGGRSGRGHTSHGRALCLNPERVLDAPEFPANHPARLIDWGSNNKLIIGLKGSLYAWDAGTGQSGEMVVLRGGLQIDCVQWLHKCACVALSVGGGTTAIYDCRSDEFIRTVRLPAGLAVSGIAVNGPIMAVSSNGTTGLTQAFDLRAKSALAATYEGHGEGGVTALQYCGSEPYHLATGGRDGHVRIWDSRRSQVVRYAHDSLHSASSGGVTALQWHPERRSRLFTGGGDGVLCLLDTHTAGRAADADADDDSASVLLGGLSGSSTSTLLTGPCGSTGGVGVAGVTGSGGTLPISRAVKSPYPISGLTVHSGEVLTSHRGLGQLQLRRASSFQLLGVFTAPNCTQGLSCLTLAPDKQVVCAAQEDETLKFWRVFEPTPIDGVEDRARSHRDARLLPSSYRDPISRLEDQLR